MNSIENRTPKQQMLAILKDQPDESSFDELLRELACRCAVKRGLDDVDQGRIMNNEEAHHRVNKSWSLIATVFAALVMVNLIGVIEKSNQKDQLEKLENTLTQLEQTVKD